jgi:sec-independent protein translocase protein TatC
MSASRQTGRPPETDEEPLPDEVEQYRMPLLDHLRELRTRLLMAVVALVVGFCISLAFVNDIIEFITAPVKDALAANGIGGGLAIVNSPFEGVTVWMHAAFIGAIVLSSPVIAYQLWAFVAPGLYQTERKLVAPLAFSSTLLFFAGAGFAYYVIFPYAFPFFFTVVDADVSLSIQGYLSAVLKMLIAFGVSFQLPIGTFFLARMGLIDHTDMRGAFRYAIVGIFIVAAVITPPDVLTQTLLAIPLILLYGLSIVVAWMFTTKVRT